MSSDVPISIQIETCERAAHHYRDNTSEGRALRAAAETLRKIQAGELVPLQEALDKFRDGLAKDFLQEHNFHGFD